MEHLEAQKIATGIVHSYIGPDHKVLNMGDLAAGIIQALRDAHKSGSEEVSRLCSLLEKSSKEVGFLDRSLMTLAGRIQAFDGEKRPAAHTWQYSPQYCRHTTVRQMADAVGEMLNHMGNMERDLAALRAKIDAMESGGYLAEELGPYMKKASPKRRR